MLKKNASEKNDTIVGPPTIPLSQNYFGKLDTIVDPHTNRRTTLYIYVYINSLHNIYMYIYTYIHMTRKMR